MADYTLQHTGAELDSATSRALPNGALDTAINGKYTKPSGGIPDSDIASATTWNGKSAKGNVLTGTLTVAGWTDNSQTITITGLATNGYAYTVAPTSADASKWITAKCLASDVTVANSLTVTCETTPTEAINLIVLKVEVQ